MSRSSFLLWITCAVLAAAAPSVARAQHHEGGRRTPASTRDEGGRRTPDGASTRDTLRSYDLQEIVIDAGNAPEQTPATIQRVRLAAITQTEAPSVADAVRLIPAAHVQTNSRGEALVYLRNAGERQVAFFLDGALLNVPWDHRVDMNLVPAGIVGGMTVAKGVVPVEYGANTVAGAVNLTSRELEGEGRVTEAAAAAGSQASFQGSLTHLARRAASSFSAAVGYARRGGIPVPAGVNLPFSQEGSRRTNTDARMLNLFARGAYDVNARSQVGLSVLHVRSEMGVAPESHLDPALENVRYWRYPDRHSTMLVGSGEGRLGTSSTWKAAAWLSAFSQTIDDYADASYDVRQRRQENDDLTLGTRLVLQRTVGRGAFLAAMNALSSRHEQRDLSLTNPSVESPRLTFRHHLLSLGARYEARPTDRLSASFGGSIDGMVPSETGDKPPGSPLVDVSLTAGARLDPGRTWFLRASAARKTRFPTMREQFGEALQRFLLNPDLQPESSVLAELGAGMRTTAGAFELIPFAALTRHTIDQRIVTVDGARRRQRINLRGSRTLGFEMVASASVLPRVEVSGHATVMRVVRLRDTPGEPGKLSEKPEALGRVAARYSGRQRLSGLLEAVYTGPAYSLNVDGAFERLEPSLVLNIRLAYRFRVGRAPSLEFFFRVDNATDALVQPQLGLPAAGRALKAGVELAL